jgi:deoxyribonuclease-1
MYMEWAYPGHGIISNKNQKLFEAWNKLYPVSDWECQRNDLIEEAQGNPNPIVKTACQKIAALK